MNRKRKVSDSVSKDEASDTGAPVDKSAKFDESGPFCMVKFIASLESEENAINELEKFTHAAELFASGATTDDVAQQFLARTEGDLHSLANLIRKQKSTTYAVARVYRCLELLLHHVAEESPHLSTSVVSSLQQPLLQSKHHLEQSLTMSRSKFNHVRAALRMLTALAVLGPEGARLVTQVVHFDSSHFRVLLHWRNVKDPEDIRTCAVYLLLSIFATGRNTVVRQILETKGLLNTIFLGLTFDRAPFICNFLLTLRAKVVRNMAFTKTTKMHLFNEGTLQHVLYLLSWTGPRELYIHPRAKKFCKEPSDDDDEEKRAVLQVSQEDIESVQAAALEFLQEVCCSHKIGISFRDTSLGLTKNVNPTITKLLQSTSKLYESTRGEEFIVQIMCACPEQITYYLHTWMPLLSNAHAQTTEKMIAVLQQVVVNQDIALCLQNMADKSPTEMCEAMMTLSALDFLPCISEAQCMQDSSSGLGVHLSYMKLLLASLDKICSALRLVRSNAFAPLAKPGAREKFESALTTAVRKNVPPASDLVSKYLAIVTKAESGRQVLTTVTEEENPLIYVRGKYCLAILQVLELYWVVFSQKTCTDSGEEYLNWELLCQLFQTSTDALQRDVSENLQLRAIQLVVNAAPTLESLFAQSERSVFHHLLTLLAQGTDETKRKRASSLVMQILCKMSVLEPYGEEMNIWIEKVCLAQLGQHTALVNLIITAVQLLLNDPNTYNDEVMQCITESNALERQSSVDLWDVLRSNTECRVNTQELDISDCGRYFSPLLPAILESFQSLSEPVCRQYIDAVVVEILHIQQQPGALCMFLENSASQLPSSIRCYIEILSEGGEKHTTKDPALLEPNAFYDPLVPKLGSYFIRQIVAASKKRKRKSMSSEVDMDGIMSAVKDAPRKSSLFCQILFYVKTLFDHEELLSLMPEYLGLLKAILESSFDASDIPSQDILHLLNLLLRHETTLTWYLNVGALDTAYQSSTLEYTQLILDTVLLARRRCTSTALAAITDPLCLLKDKTVLSISSGGAAFCNLWSNIVRAFATMFSEHDIVVLLEDMLALPGDLSLDATKMLMTELSARSPRREQTHAYLSAAAINKAVAMKLMLDEEDVNMDKDEFGNAVLHLFMSHPSYCAAVEPDCIEQLASSISFLELLSFIMEHSPAHRLLFHGMISCQEIRLHPNASPQGLGALLAAIAKTLEQVDPAVSAWVVKQFLKLCKRLSTVEEPLPYNVVQPIADTATSLLNFKLLDKKDIQKLLDMVGDTTNNLLRLVLLNRISEGATPDFKESLLDSILQHLLASVCKAAQDEEPAACGFEELERSVIVFKQFNEKSFVRAACRDNFWQQCIVSLLKSAFKSFSMGAVVFKLISAACETVYMDTGVTTHPSAANIYMMILGHSKFLSIMLDMDVEAQEARGSLLELMTTLVKREKSICSVDHVPLYLSAYGATLSIVDQKVLYLLYLYEESGVDMTMFRPYMWGPSAASFYSVYKKSSRSLLKQPKTEEILGLFNDGIMASSLLRFPLDLDLQPIPHEDAADKSVYDPRFVLPLLYNLLSPGSLLQCRQFVELRFLAYVLHSLCSEVFQVRALGYNVLCLFYQHLEGSRYSNSTFWLCVLQSLRNALTVTSARLPCLLAGYLAKAVQAIHSPAHDAFNPVLNFLLAKPVININNVPDFYRMFFNQSIKHRFRRSWFLEMVASNLRSSLDFHICCNRYVLGIFKAYFMASTCTKQSKELVLKIFLAAVKIPKAARTLCREQGLLGWVSAALARSSDDAVLSKLLFDVVHQVWWSSSAEILTYMDKMVAALKKEHEAISLLAPEHQVKTDVLRGHDVEDTSFLHTVPAAYSNPSADVVKVPPKRRFYEHFPFEFLLALCDMCKYVRNCSDLTTVTHYIQDMGDAFTYIHTRNSMGLSATEDVFRPGTQLILSILEIWEHFSKCDKSERLNPLVEGIIQVCEHWLPVCAGSQDLWIRTLDVALEYSKQGTSDGVLKWVSLWLKSDNFAHALVSDCKRLNRIVDMARDVLCCGGGCASEKDASIIAVLHVLLNQAVEETLNEELKPKYQKAMRSLKKKSLTDKQRALATTVLLQELLLKKAKPHLFGMYVNTCVNVEQAI
ncbi:nucleolar pre-ribosomal-associated protein 1-like [Ornithodoros turicata]|uniref:nucleolar pre-ribosomal-associated protein 1-like n=1 Tax=Ornithodoros turicata TaxID=34597 RepID=UPI003139B069